MTEWWRLRAPCECRSICRSDSVVVNLRRRPWLDCSTADTSCALADTVVEDEDALMNHARWGWMCWRGKDRELIRNLNVVRRSGWREDKSLRSR
jgi:hypothetical protein